MAKAAPKKPATKTAMFQTLADKTDLTKKQIATVFDELTAFIEKEVSRRGPGVVTLPGLLKIKRVVKPATKERMGRNPQTGEPMKIAAKPKRVTVRVLALKKLKEMVT